MENLKTSSKFLSLILRHKPETIGIVPDENGWVLVKDLIEKINQHNRELDMATLKEIVATNDKKRFAFNEDETKIRASQGHSLAIDLQLQPVEPPAFLYHGTVPKYLDAIKANGLQKMNRQHVHLSKDKATATVVGNRRGKATILTICAGDMHNDGLLFYISDNGVWLCEEVPAKYIQF